MRFPQQRPALTCCSCPANPRGQWIFAEDLCWYGSPSQMTPRFAALPLPFPCSDQLSLMVCNKALPHVQFFRGKKQNFFAFISA